MDYTDRRASRKIRGGEQMFHRAKSLRPSAVY